MALIKLGIVVSDISGKVSGNVFSKNRGGNYIRNWSKPTNPDTPRQRAARQKMTFVSSGWRMLTDAQRTSWDESAKIRPVINRMGESKNLSGFGLYVKQNLALQVADVGTLASAPAAKAIHSMVINSVEVVLDTVQITISRADKTDLMQSDAEYAVIGVSAPTSPGRKPSGYRQFGAFNDSSPEVANNDSTAVITIPLADLQEVTGEISPTQGVEFTVMPLDTEDPWDTLNDKYFLDGIAPVPAP